MAVRKFIATAPRQSIVQADSEQGIPYKVTNNSRLEYAESYSFPVINIMHGYVEEGDDVELLIIEADHPMCHKNVHYIEEQARKVCNNVGVSSFQLIPIHVNFTEESENHLLLFQNLVEHIHDGDRLAACITYGSKPTPLLEVMALNYGYRSCKNVSVDCIAYGGMDHLGKDNQEKRKMIYDVTSLFLMDQIVNELAKNGHHRTLDIIKGILSDE